MADIVMADDGIGFDGTSLAAGPLGGAETAFVSLAEAVAARGHRVLVRTNCGRRARHAGVDWAPLADGLPERCDLYIANRGDKLLALMPQARRTVFWIHNPARYLLKWRYLGKLWRRRPAIVFSGRFHAASYPRWAPCGARVTIPYGISEVFRRAPPPSAPASAASAAPRAVFTSSPLRSLDWLLGLWCERIRPRAPQAELHLFSSAATYGAHGVARTEPIQAVLARAAALADCGVVVRGPVAKEALARELALARVLLYRGDEGETFCLAVGEAQAAGVPCVVQDVGCVAERVIDGETGFVAAADAGFAEAALLLLGDDALWRRQSDAARERQRGWGWSDAAAAFEELIP